MTNKSGTLYVGVTNDLERRIREHKEGTTAGFAKRYGLSRLVYHENTTSIDAAISREKQIKGWRRARKFELIESVDAKWEDLAENWYE